MTGKQFNVLEFVEKARALAKKEVEHAHAAERANAQTASALSQSLLFTFKHYGVDGITIATHNDVVALSKENDTFIIHVQNSDCYSCTRNKTKKPGYTNPSDGTNTDICSADEMQQRTCDWAGIRLK